MDIAEFRRLGFLQEANRLFFHPLGLALEIMEAEGNAPAYISGVWDCRDDPEGVVFGRDVAEWSARVSVQMKADRVALEGERHAEARKALLGGFTIQRIFGVAP
jgi:hypothetical protein